VIGFGAPTKAGTTSVHGSPLGKDEIAAPAQAARLDHGPFEMPEAKPSERLAQDRHAQRQVARPWEGKNLAAMARRMRAEFDRRT
jgi:transketolase